MLSIGVDAGRIYHRRRLRLPPFDFLTPLGHEDSNFFEARALPFMTSLNGATDAVPLSRELEIINKRGLHARASAKFVKCVERFDAKVSVTRLGETVGGRSIMGLLTLAAAQGTSITVTAEGPQALEALEALEALVASKFDEGE
jgi:phosphocarrier protein